MSLPDSLRKTLPSGRVQTSATSVSVRDTGTGTCPTGSLEGTLTSIDIQKVCCRQLEECLVNERNPNPVRVIHSDVMLLNDLKEQFDIVTMVGSARMESGLHEDILAQAVSFLKPGGSLYYQSIDKNETGDWVRAFCETGHAAVSAYLLDTAYDFKAQYWKLTKNKELL